MRVTVSPHYQENPYQTELYSAMPSDVVSVSFVQGQAFWLRAVRETRPDLMHFHWLDKCLLESRLWKSAIKSTSFLTQLARLRSDGVAVVWTCHNLVNHRHVWPWIERRALRRAQNAFDRVLVHDPSQVQPVAEAFGIRDPERRIRVVPHAAYGDVYPAGESRAYMRRRFDLGPDDDVFLMFGSLQRRKQLDLLMNAFRSADLPRARLVIVGKGDPSLVDELKGLAGEDSRVRFRPGLVEDSDVRALHEMSDVVLLPYATGLTSGALILAMEHGKPVVATPFPHAQTMLGPKGEGGCLVDGEVASFVKAISQMTDQRDSWAKMGQRNRSVASQQTWQTMAEQTLRCYQDVIAERAG